MPGTYMKIDGVEGESPNSTRRDDDPELILIEPASEMGDYIVFADPADDEYARGQDVRVSSYQSSGSAGGDSIPQDSFTLNFSKIETYPAAEADDDAGAGSSIVLDEEHIYIG